MRTTYKHLTILAAGCISLGALSLPTGAAHVASYPLRKAKHCRVDYVKRTERHKVKGKEQRYVACVYWAPAPTTTLPPAPPPTTVPATTTTTTTPPPATTTTTAPAPQPNPGPLPLPPSPTPSYAYKAHLDPSFTQGSSALDVTFDFSADATETLGNVQTDLASTNQLPNGILDFYSNGSLACSVNVGGSVNSGTCEITYAHYGNQTVVTEYIPNSVSPVTETDTEDIEPYTPTITPGTATIGSETVDSNNDYAVLVTIPVTVSGDGATPTGTISASGMTCSALTSGSGSCTETIENSADASSFAPTISYSGDANYSSGSADGSATIPAAPAPQVTDISTSITGGWNDDGAGMESLYGIVEPFDHQSTNAPGSVTFTWSGPASPVTVTTNSDGTFTSADMDGSSDIGFNSTITVSYSGATKTKGDAYEYVYASCSATFQFT